MTTEEKYKAITEKLKNKNIDFDPIHISSMVVIGYLNDLAKLGLIETEYKITEMGENVRAICEEFDWKPSDEEIIRIENLLNNRPRKRLDYLTPSEVLFQGVALLT